MKKLIFIALATAGLGFAAPALAADQVPAAAETAKTPGIPAAILTKLRKGCCNIYFRHGMTPNYLDPGEGEDDNCSTQRNLSKEGIAQMKAVGEAFFDLEIPVGVVRASPMCRGKDTARYAFGRYDIDDNLRLTGSSPESNAREARQWRYLRAIGKVVPLAGTNSVFVSHGTVGDAFGAGYLDEGEAVVIEPDGFGGWKLLMRVKSNMWHGE